MKGTTREINDIKDKIQIRYMSLGFLLYFLSIINPINIIINLFIFIIDVWISVFNLIASAFQFEIPFIKPRLLFYNKRMSIKNVSKRILLKTKRYFSNEDWQQIIKYFEIEDTKNNYKHNQKDKKIKDIIKKIVSNTSCNTGNHTYNLNKYDFDGYWYDPDWSISHKEITYGKYIIHDSRDIIKVSYNPNNSLLTAYNSSEDTSEDFYSKERLPIFSNALTVSIAMALKFLLLNPEKYLIYISYSRLHVWTKIIAILD